MLALKPVTEDRGRLMVQAREPSHQSGYLRLVGLPPTGSHACYTPWSVFQDGQIGGLPPAS